MTQYSETFGIRAEPAHVRLWTRAARSAGFDTSVSGWARHALVKAACDQLRSDPDAIRQLAAEAGRVLGYAEDEVREARA